MKIRDKRESRALKELMARKRLTTADLAEAASRGERRLKAEEMARLGQSLSDHFERRGFARRVAGSSIIEWVPPMK